MSTAPPKLKRLVKYARGTAMSVAITTDTLAT